MIKLFWLERNFIRLMEVMELKVKISKNRRLKTKTILVEIDNDSKINCSHRVKETSGEVLGFFKIENMTNLNVREELEFFHQFFRFIVMRKDHWFVGSIEKEIYDFEKLALKIKI